MLYLDVIRCYFLLSIVNVSQWFSYSSELCSFNRLGSSWVKREAVDSLVLYGSFFIPSTYGNLEWKHEQQRWQHETWHEVQLQIFSNLALIIFRRYLWQPTIKTTGNKLQLHLRGFTYIILSAILNIELVSLLIF